MQKNKIVTVWALVITMSVIALAVGWFAITRHHPPANAQTVEEAIAGGVLQIENPYSPTNVDDEDRMYSLAEALGIPIESMPREIFESASNRTEARLTMVQILKKAQEQGTLNRTEAEAVLAALTQASSTPPWTPSLRKAHRLNGSADRWALDLHLATSTCKTSHQYTVAVQGGSKFSPAQDLNLNVIKVIKVTNA